MGPVSFYMVVMAVLSIVVGAGFTVAVGYALWLGIRRSRAELDEGTQTQLQYRILDELEAVQLRFDIISERLDRMERRLPPGVEAPGNDAPRLLRESETTSTD